MSRSRKRRWAGAGAASDSTASRAAVCSTRARSPRSPSLCANRRATYAALSGAVTGVPRRRSPSLAHELEHAGPLAVLLAEGHEATQVDADSPPLGTVGPLAALLAAHGALLHELGGPEHEDPGLEPLAELVLSHREAVRKGGRDGLVVGNFPIDGAHPFPLFVHDSAHVGGGTRLRLRPALRVGVVSVHRVGDAVGDLGCVGPESRERGRERGGGNVARRRGPGGVRARVGACVTEGPVTRGRWRWCRERGVTGRGRRRAHGLVARERHGHGRRSEERESRRRAGHPFYSTPKPTWRFHPFF